uniref:DUF8201 domain-containing protein n=1 Tax=Solibacter usitatus (strain Ellin6076) TaxID=234267 RepID=Q01ZZ9_SOLUE
MREVANILFGAAFTIAVSVAIGQLLLERLRIGLYRWEATLIAFIAGSGCLSLGVTLLCFVHQARRGVFLWAGLAVIGIAIRRSRRWKARRGLPAVSLNWLVLFYVLFGILFLYYFVNALAPEISPDGSGYHLGNVLRTWRNHGSVWDYHSMYSYFSQGMEMLFLVAFSFGRHSSAALVHFAFLCTLPLLMVSWGRRFGYAKAAIFAGIVVFASPVIAKDGISAYNDVAVATLIYAVFYLIQVWDEDRDPKLLFLIGLLSGFCYAAKYTAVLTLPFAAAWIWWRGDERRWRDLVRLVVPASLMVLPWVLRNWIWLGNPFAPFLNAWFPNPYYHAGMERIYADSLFHYNGIKHNWEIPLQLTVRGGLVGGLFGPIFLLVPLCLLALRFKYGRRLLAAGLVFAAPAYLNSDSRFLIPCAPFFAMAMGLALADVPGALPALALFQALLCWPPVLTTWCHPWNWRISSWPIREALRLEPAAPFITHSIGDYALKNAIEREVPPGEQVFSFAGRPQAYFDRDIVVFYESTLGNLVQDILLAPDSHPPHYQERFRFLPVTTRGVRVVNNASAPGLWTLAELRLRSAGRELPRSKSWRLSAWPNGEEVQLAFDNSYATRWSTWEAMAPHARVQVDFPEPTVVDEVVLECDPAWDTRLQVEVLSSDGRWVAITDTAEYVKADFPSGIRRAATRDVKALGFRYLLLNDGDEVYKDMNKYPKFWGVTQVAEANGTHLYRID